MLPEGTHTIARDRVPVAVRAQVDALLTTRRRARIDHRPLMLRALGGLLLVTVAIVAVIAVTETGWAGNLHGRALHGWGIASHAVVTGSFVTAIALVRAWARLDTMALAVVAVAGLGTSAWLVHLERPLPATFAAIAGATAAGFLVAGSVARVTWLVPLAIAGSLSDARSVAHGTTHALLQAATVRDTVDMSGVAGVRLFASPPTNLDLLVLHLPAISGPWVLGSIDVVVVALFVAATVQFRLSIIRTVIALTTALTVAAIPDHGVAVIPLLSAAYVLVHARPLVRAGSYAWRRALVHAGLHP